MASAPASPCPGTVTFSSELTLVGSAEVAFCLTLASFVFVPIISFGTGGAFTPSMTPLLDNVLNVEEANGQSASPS